MSNLQARLDKYVNSEYADPLAIGLISELRAHLKAANKVSERVWEHSYKRLLESLDFSKRVTAIEEKINTPTEDR